MKRYLAILFTAAIFFHLIPGRANGQIIGISSANSQVTLTFPTNDFWLQSSGTMFPDDWVNVTNPPNLIGATDSVTMPLANSAQFFRLVQSAYLPPPTELEAAPDEDIFGDVWLQVWWDPVAQASSYNLYYASDPSVTKNNYSLLTNGAVITGITNPVVAVSNLQAGAQYYFVATAVDASGESADSNPGSGIFGQFADLAGTVSALVTIGTNQILEVIPGVTITLSNLDQPALSSQTISDIDGDYGFPSQPAGTYQLSWSAPGFVAGSLSSMIVITDEPIDGEDITLTNDSTGSVYGHVELGDGSLAVQSDSFYGIQESVSVSLGMAGQPPIQTVMADSAGNYVIAGVAPQSGLTLSVSNGAVSASTNINVTGAQEVDFMLPETPPVIVMSYGSTNGVYITQAAQGTTVQVTVVATNSAGGTNGLHYGWRPDSDTTNFTSIDQATVNWTLPYVGGIQTMYVVVSDNLGGYATARIRISTDLGALFGGVVADNTGSPITGATVSVGGQVTTSDTNGNFSVLVSNLAPSYSVVATQPGYVPFTAIFASECQSVTCTMVPEPPCQQADPSTNYVEQDPFGTVLMIPANSVNSVSTGMPATSICVTLATLDPCSAASQLGISPVGIQNGTNVLLEFLALADVEITDQYGGPVALTTNMALNINADTNCIDTLTNEDVSLWWYDEVAAVWRPAGSVNTAVNAGVTTFAARPPQKGPLGVARVRPVPGRLANFFLTLDATISLPADVRITIGPAGNVQELVTATVTTRPFIFSQLPLTGFHIDVISPKEAPGFYPPNADSATKTVIVAVDVPANTTNITTGLSAQIPSLPNARVDNTDMFLTASFGAGTNAVAAKYYSLVDPNNRKTLLGDWKAANRFFTNGGTISEDTNAIFFNACDLGFGRSMHFRAYPDPNDGKTNYAFYVSNYQDAGLASSNRGLIATVAMDWSPNPLNPSNRIIAFYVFNKGGVRINSADLDGAGEKFVPNLCLVCHGGNSVSMLKFEQKVATTDREYFKSHPDAADFGAHFLPFDLDSYTYAQPEPVNGGRTNKLSRAGQEAAFNRMNQAIADTNTGPTPAMTNVIAGWYQNGSFAGNYVPPSWNNPPNVSAGYTNAFAISCRSCHVTRETLSFFEFSNLSSNTVGKFVYKVDEKVMPNALRTFTIFWGSQSANVIQAGVVPNQPQALQNALGLTVPSPSKFP